MSCAALPCLFSDTQVLAIIICTAQALLAEDAAAVAVGALAGLTADEPAAPLGLISRLVLAEPPALGAQFAGQVLRAGGLAPELLLRCVQRNTLEGFVRACEA